MRYHASAMLDVSNRSRVDVALVERDARALLTLFAELLESLGLGASARVLPLVGDHDAEVRDAVALRAVTMGLHLLSVAEQHAAALHRRDAEAEGASESGLWASTVAELAAQPGGVAAMIDAMATLEVEPVFTAHPTEARRVSALEQWLDLANDLAAHGHGPEDEPRRDALRTRLERLFRTGEVRLRKPRVADERNIVVHTLARVVAPALARVDAAAEAALAQVAPGAARPTARFASWVGGDRDGHPLVTAEVTRESLAVYRSAALALHREQLVGLVRSLSLSALGTEVLPELAQRIAEVSAALGARGEVAQRYPEEPFRAWCALMLARIPAPDGPREGDYGSPAELEHDLELLRRALEAAGAARLARADVAPALAAVRAFGFHLVALDLRQNSSVHDRALDALRRGAGEAGELAAWPEGERRAYLERELESGRPFTMPGSALDPDAEIAVAPLRVAAAHRARHGGAGLGSLIVSMTRDVSDLLVPYVLAREAGLLVREGGELASPLASPIAIVPLFETLDDLERAPAVLDAYLAIPIVRRSLAAQSAGRAPVQQVMVGYSDSNKDAGPCASSWGVHVAQREMLRVAAQHGVALRFFHGRGGSASRGAGPTFRFLSALPAGGLSRGLRTTEQGEVVFQKYGTVDAAAYNLELLIAGAVRGRSLDALERHASVARERGADDPALERAMHEVAKASSAAYRRLIDTEGLFELFREATPIDVIEQSGIGSRPSRRSGQATLADLRAIPWVFAWAQSRFGLTGWFGLGAGLEALEQRDPDAHRALVARALSWAPLRYIVGNASVSVLAVDPEVTPLYAELVADDAVRARVGQVIEAELARTRRALERVYGGPLEQARARVHQLMSIRAPSLRRVHRRQVELLRAWRAGGRSDDAIKIELLGTVNAIAAGLRTTG